MKLGPATFIQSDFGNSPLNIANVKKDVIAPYKHAIGSYVDDQSSFDSRKTLLYFKIASDNMLAKTKNSIRYVMEVVECETTKVHEPCCTTLLPCKLAPNTLVAAVILAGGKLIDAPPICNRLIRKLQQQPTFTMDLGALSLRCYVLILDSQGISITYSAWVSSSLPMDLYVEAETFLWRTKIFNSSLAFENGKKSHLVLKSSLELFLNMSPHILEFISLFLYDKFKKYFKGVSEEDLRICCYSMAFMKGNHINKRPMSKTISEDGVFIHSTLTEFCVNAIKFELAELLYEEIEQNIVLFGYGKKCMCDKMENVLFSRLQGTNCKLAGWTMRYFLICFFDNMGMLYMMDYWFRKLGIVLMAALHHLLEEIGQNFTSGKEQQQSEFKSWHFMHYMLSWLGDRVVSNSPLKDAAGEKVVLFRNLELHSLKLKLNFNLVLMFECQEYFVVAVLHRKMIPRGQLVLLQSLDPLRFDHENAARSLNSHSIYIMLAIAVSIDWGNIQEAKVLIKWKALPS